MRILVTGAAGLIGGEICARLAAEGHAVTALVHHRHDVTGNDGTTVPSRIADGVPPGPGEVVTIAGDVRTPMLGLADVPAIDMVIHSAAITAFDAESEVYAAVNRGGTANAIAVAQAAGAGLLHISTAYVCGTSDGAVLESQTGSEFVNGYEASKAAGEALVHAAMARGLRAAIARPSIVVGDSTTGRIRSFDNIYMIFRLIAEGRVRTLPGAPGASLDLVPIDHVCNGIMAMVADFDAVAGKTLHLVADAPTPLTAIGAAIAAVPGLGTPNFVAPEAFDPAALPPIERRYHAAAAALYTNYLLRGPRFDTSIARAFAPPCPPTDRVWLDRLIGYCVKARFVRARERA